jgi:hypothetical protein
MVALPTAYAVGYKYAAPLALIHLRRYLPHASAWGYYWVAASRQGFYRMHSGGLALIANIMEALWIFIGIWLLQVGGAFLIARQVRKGNVTISESQWWRFIALPVGLPGMLGFGLLLVMDWTSMFGRFWPLTTLCVLLIATSGLFIWRLKDV